MKNNIVPLLKFFLCGLLLFLGRDWAFSQKNIFADFEDIGKKKSIERWQGSLSQKNKEIVAQREVVNEKDTTSHAKVYIYYTPSVNGYKVVLTWQPFSSDSETGTAVMTFTHVETGKQFVYYDDEKYCNAETCNIVFSPDFKGHRDGDVYTMPYDTVPKQDGSPFYSEAPFQFYDIDFDGEDEVLINNYDQLRCGNSYQVCRIRGNRLLPATDLPMKGVVDEEMKIDRQQQTWTAFSCDGCFDALYWTYKKGKGTTVRHLPVFKTVVADWCVDDFRDTLQTFHLVQVKESKRNYLPGNNGDWYYIVKGDSLVLERSQTDEVTRRGSLQDKLFWKHMEE